MHKKYKNKFATDQDKNNDPTKFTHQITVRTCWCWVKRRGYPSVLPCTQSTAIHRPSAPTIQQQQTHLTGATLLSSAMALPLPPPYQDPSLQGFTRVLTLLCSSNTSMSQAHAHLLSVRSSPSHLTPTPYAAP
ncbi:unnamed protein product, partial [Ectocarpus fasciculatus]